MPSARVHAQGARLVLTSCDDSSVVGVEHRRSGRFSLAASSPQHLMPSVADSTRAKSHRRHGLLERRSHSACDSVMTVSGASG